MPKLRNPQVVKIFFSSPFGGMEEEREELTRRYFPSIHHLCNSHGLQFAAVDMRWGITAESSEKAQVINICLREIVRSDMFVGFFGQRYGWHGADDAALQKNFDNALPFYPWLDTVRDKSVTELEFLHGFLNDPGSLPAALFFRDKAYDDVMRTDGLQKGDKKQVFKYSAESEHSSRLRDDLKQRVWQHRDKSLGVHLDYKTPAQAAKIMYDTIMLYLKDTLLADLDKEKLSKREELLSQHDVFLSSRCNIYVQGEGYIEQLNKQLLSEQRQHVLVTGDAGCGKSALLCNWLSALKQKRNNYAVVYHFIGFADSSTDVNSMLSRLGDEFEYILSLMTDDTARIEDNDETPSYRNDADDDEDDAQKTRRLIQRLLSVLNKLVSLGKTPVLVLDGLDKVRTTQKIKKVLFWLPAHFPTSSMVVVSTLLTDAENIEELGARQYLTIHIDPLAPDYKHKMCVKGLQESGKELSAPQLQRVVDAEMTKNPLYLKITLSELVAFGYFRLLDKKIDSLITCESIEALFQQVLIRLEEDYNVLDDHCNLVEQVMSSIHLSCQGLSETEVKEIFSIPDHVWSPLYFAIENLTINHSGRIQYGFRELGEAVQIKYLHDQDKKKYYIEKMVDYFKNNLHELDQSDRLDGADLKMCRPAYELPPLLLELGDMDKFAACLSNFFVFSHLSSNNPYQLVLFWRLTKLTEDEIAARLLASFDKRVSHIYLYMEEHCMLQTYEPPGLRLVIFLQHIDHILTTSGFRVASKEVLLRAINVVEDGLQRGKVNNVKHRETLLNNLKYKLACIYSTFYHTAEQGIQLHKEIMQRLQSQLESSDEMKTYKTSDLLAELGHLSHGIGVAYITLGENEKAEDFIRQSMKYQDESGKINLSDTGAAWSNLGKTCLQKKEFEKALEYMDNSIKAFEEHHFGENPPVIGEMLTNKAICLRNLGRLDEAEQVYFKSLEVKINAVGKEHAIVALAYMNLGIVEQCRGDTDAAIQYAKQAVQTYEAVGQTWDNPDYIAAWENVLQFLTNKQNFEEADKTFMTILNWRIKDGTLDHSLPGLCHEMAKYYFREEQWEKAYDICCAVINSKYRTWEENSHYVLLDMTCEHLPQEFTERLEKKYTLAHAVELQPDNVHLVKRLVEDHLVHKKDYEEIARLINRLHGLSDMGVDVYVLTCDWCKTSEGEINEAYQQTIIKEGLLIYPDNMDLHLNMAKSYRRSQQPGLALPHALMIAEMQLDNPQLLLFTAYTAALAGECDVCIKWCSYMQEHFEDESVTTPVKALVEMNEEAREYIKQTEQADTEKENIGTEGSQ